MSRGEFELIRRHFTARGAARGDVRLGVGDDAAVTAVPAGMELVLALDTIVAGVHFPEDTAARCVGHRALAVNLSDLAAMGASAAWALLGLTLPAADEAWIAEFAAGFDQLARRHEVALIGGDLTRGPLAASVAVAGFVGAGQALMRTGASPGDDVWVSGNPGEAGAGLAILQGRLAPGAEARDRLLARFLLPEPRLDLGRALAGIATSCIDISDGLVGDLGRLCAASGMAAEIDAARLPLSAALRTAAGEGAARLALDAGDDYELLFTAPAADRGRIEALHAGVGLSRIGVMSAGEGVRVAGAAVERDADHGFDHFAD